MRRSQSAAPDLPAQRFRHERGAKIWIWRPQADRSKIPKGLWEPDLANASPDIARGRVIADVASQRSPTRFTARRAELSRSDTYLTFGQFLSSAASVRTWTAAPQPAAPQGFSISRKPRGTRAVTRRRSEPSHSSAHRCKQCSRRRAPPPGRYSSSAFVIAPTASSTTRTETNH